MKRIILAAIMLGVVGCWEDDMADRSRIKPMEASSVFPDGKSARPLVIGTVPRGGTTVADPIYAVTAPKGPPATAFPEPLAAEHIERGRQQYDIYCSVCHGATGKGDGMIVQRGFPRPPSIYLDRLRTAPHGHFYNVITHGYGAMYSYSERIVPADRWKIVGYIRALQLSDPHDKGEQPPATSTTRPK